MLNLNNKEHRPLMRLRRPPLGLLGLEIHSKQPRLERKDTQTSKSWTYCCVYASSPLPEADVSLRRFRSCAHPSTNMALAKSVYNLLFRRTSTFAITIMVGAVFFERIFDHGGDAIFEQMNHGVSLTAAVFLLLVSS